ncbi:ATP-grasp domain-containing protein [Lentzea sp.]|uniref:ATP-grasp domain-containing protein n=1 Tax=Lentzea sp. TaxID=56099 RepID=UPI002C3E3DE2|nr:ATP-grasp domain-containing protein [Lentzea sp.]HUQ54073.1 ATP-grasp domain-containing protein [Lentzea sp.]
MKVLMLRHNWHQLVLDHADEVYAVLDSSPGCLALSPATLARFARVYRVSSYDSLEELSAVAGDLLTRGIEIDRIVSFPEFTQYAAGYLAHLLGLDHYSSSVALATRDKRVTKFRAAQAGVPTARWYSIPDLAAADPDSIGQAVGYPLVLKPAGGWGTVSTVKVSDRAELVDALRTIPEGLPSPLAAQFVAEEFIAGEEFHVDAVWRDGRPWFFYVSRYFSPRLQAWSGRAAHGSVLLRESEFADLYAELLKINTRLNSALGVERGATHLEVFREQDTGRLLVSEIASRVGGANVSDVIEALNGVHGGRIALHELLDGDRADLPFAPGSHPVVGGLCLVPDRSGVIVSTPDRSELLAHPNVLGAVSYHQVGDYVEASHPSLWCTLLVIGAETESELERTALALSETFTIRTAPVG